MVALLSTYPLRSIRLCWQAFHNLNPYADIFNHANIHFWEYMQPGYDALNFISCTGTNFLMRAQAFSEVSRVFTQAAPIHASQQSTTHSPQDRPLTTPTEQCRRSGAIMHALQPTKPTTQPAPSE